MKRLFFIIIGVLHYSLFLQAQDMGREPGASAGTVKSFTEAFIFQYIAHGEVKELWLYYNPEAQEVLYVPADDMLQAVISFPNGDYVGYMADETGKRRTIRQHVPEVAEVDTSRTRTFHRIVPKPQLEKMTLREFQRNEFVISSAISIEYLKSGERETVCFAEDFVVNAYQIYGFNRLAGDMRLPFALDYIGILTKRQLATAVEDNPYQTVRLIGHTATVYNFDTKGFE